MHSKFFTYFHLRLVLGALSILYVAGCHSDYLDADTEGAHSTDSDSIPPVDDSDISSDSDSGESTDSTVPPDTETDTEIDTNELLFPDTDWDVETIGVVPFQEGQILDYHIVMDEALYQELLQYGDDEQYREASITVNAAGVELFFPKVGIRYKGDYSLHHCWTSGSRSYSGDCAKLSLKIKFNEFYEHARFYGLKKINLHAMSADSTKMRERLAYQMYAEFDVDAPRTAYARVRFNDEEPQLMLAVEQVDGRYTAYHYPHGGDGNLFKEIWPRDTLSESVVKAALRTNDDPEDNADVSSFLDFGETVSTAQPDTFGAAVSPYVDVSQLLRYMVVDRAIKNWDGITAFYWSERPHNFYWYFDERGAELYRLIPWDLDNTFPMHDPYMDPIINEADEPIANWNVLPLSCTPIWVWDHSCTVIPPGCDPLINLLAATEWDAFFELGNQLLEGPFQYSVVDAKVTAWEAQIAPLVNEDPILSLAGWESQVEYLRTILQQSISDFSAHLETGYTVEQ